MLPTLRTVFEKMGLDETTYYNGIVKIVFQWGIGIALRQKCVECELKIPGVMFFQTGLCDTKICCNTNCHMIMCL